MATTVRDATYDLLRSLGMTTVFGNPGSTEEPFLKDFPADFTYVLALQEASAVAMADGYAQVTGRPAHVNLHTTPGTGNAIGNLATAWYNRVPLVVTSGQQTREMLLVEPLLTNRYPDLLPKPYVKWAYEPARAADVPGAIMRGYATAVQPPAGPVYLSIPFDDWDQQAGPAPAARRSVPESGRNRSGCGSSPTCSPRAPTRRWWWAPGWTAPAGGRPRWPSPRSCGHRSGPRRGPNGRPSRRTTRSTRGCCRRRSSRSPTSCGATTPYW
jgi:hypothetical protein